MYRAHAALGDNMAQKHGAGQNISKYPYIYICVCV